MTKEDDTLDKDQVALEEALARRDEALAVIKHYLAKNRPGDAVPAATIAEKMQRTITLMFRDRSYHGPYRHYRDRDMGGF